jgi:hypothetical protein
MQIVAIEPRPFVGLLASIYAAIGLLVFIVFELGSAEHVLIPVGLFNPEVHLLFFSLNVNRSDDPLTKAFLRLGLVFSYPLSGFLTGVAGMLCFNFLAEKTGGFAKYFFNRRYRRYCGPGTWNPCGLSHPSRQIGTDC